MADVESERPLKKRRLDADQRGPSRKLKAPKIKPVKPGSGEDAIRFEIESLIGKNSANAPDTSPFTHLQEVELDIVTLSAHGDGLGIGPTGDWVVAVPFCLPGEKVLGRVYRDAERHSYADLVKVIQSNEATDNVSSTAWTRDGSLVQCKYFGKCGGCQYQMLPYAKQLLHKQSVVTKAFINSSGLALEQLPEVQDTIPSPMQYNYRTKITPHFELPSKKLSLSDRLNQLAIGFETKGRRKVLDIEECPIATETLNAALPFEREKVKSKFGQYKRGATLLLRHSTTPIAGKSEEEGICITDHKAVVRENVAGKIFEFNAGSFFQNNNGILEELIAYVKSQLQTSITEAQDGEHYLVDAYCGSGLFAICLADQFKTVAGVEISGDSVKWAKHNASKNGVKNATFITGNAEAIFASIEFPAEQTTILIDPPRKGCDELFLTQLMAFGPRTILYVSCNVHTQARDVGILVKQGSYKIDSIRGADLFPQTYHVEGVCVLHRAR